MERMFPRRVKKGTQAPYGTSVPLSTLMRGIKADAQI